MVKKDTFTKIISVIFFLALAIYLFAWLWQSTHKNVVTAPVVAVEIQDSEEISGIAVRNETVLSSERQFISVQARDGKSVAVNAVLAIAADTEEDLAKVNRIGDLALEVQSLETALAGSSGSATASDISGRDSSIRKTILRLTGGVARGESETVNAAAMELSSLVFTQSSAATGEEQLEALRQELAQARSDAPRGTNLTAEISGIFSQNVDGFESVSGENLQNLTVTKLNAIFDTTAAATAGAFGKIVDDSIWYFAANISQDKAAMLTVGQSTKLGFSRYYGSTVPAKVVSISPAEGGVCAVVFSSRYALADTLNMRKADAEVVFSETSGLKIPIKAAHVDEYGTYVYCITAQRVEKKYIEIKATEDEFYLVAVGASADSLREGNTVIVSGQDIYEGKVIEP